MSTIIGIGLLAALAWLGISLLRYVLSGRWEIDSRLNKYSRR